MREERAGMSISEGISARFANMGFVSVCLVVLMHVHCPWEGGGISQLAVPFFFAMSGYFLASHVEEKGWYVRALSKRIRTLLVPLFAWCVIWMLFTIPIALMLNVRAGRDLFANILTGWAMLRYLALDITRTPALGPLWYVRGLIFFVIVSPAIVWLIRRTGFFVLIVLGGVYYTYATMGTNVSFLSYGFSLQGIFYFSVGLFLRMKQVSLNLGLMIGAPVFCIGLLAYCMGWTELSIVLMIVGLWGLMPTRRFPRFLVANTFPVYLMHMFILLLFGSGKIASPSLAIGVGIIVVVVSVAVAEAIRRFAPSLSVILWGGR